MDTGLIGKKYWIVETRFEDGTVIEYQYQTREECRNHIRGCKALLNRLKIETHKVLRKIYRVTIVDTKGTQLYKQLSS